MAGAEPARFDLLHCDVLHRLLTTCNERILATLDKPHRRQTRRVPGTGNPRPNPERLRASAAAEALRQLAPLEREAIVHTLHTGMTYREVAVATGRSRFATAAHLRDGLQQLHLAQTGSVAESPPADDDDAGTLPNG